MPASPRHRRSGALPGLILGIYALGMTGVIPAAAAPVTDPGDAPGSQLVPEVTVVGKADSHALDLAINKFVQSHARPSALSGQVGRWRQKVCPAVTGLQGPAAEFVSRRIDSVARSVGAPTRAVGKKCAVNIEVVFTGEPQALLDHIATKYRSLLGYYRKSELKQFTTFTHPVQAWYMTGTRSLDAGPPIPGMTRITSANACAGCDITSIINTGLKLDSAYSDGSLGLGASGNPESHFTRGLRSEFIHVFIIVNSKAVAGHSLRSISDYIALLALTRIGSPDSCSGLSSILTLFDTGCGEPPAAMTGADTAYLKALYAANLDANLNLELGDVHRRMLQMISGK